LPSTRDLERRIKSVKGTQQITKAMKMVAAAKLRRAQQRITEARPYAESLGRVLASLSQRTEHSHELLDEREESRCWLVVVTSDKGMCGSFNSNLLRRAERELKSETWDAVEVVAVGRKACDFFRHRTHTVAHEDRSLMSAPTPEAAAELAKMFITAFTSGQVDEVWLLYNRFINLVRQEDRLQRLLPIEQPAAEDQREAEDGVDYLYEPAPDQLLAQLLPQHVETQVRRAVYDSAAAEQAARMTAMDAATKNAKEMIDSLTLLYNRTRQAAITKELLEIVAGAEALQQ
jgi:F-type H+-transporting ATPase subunit gamma